MMLFYITKYFSDALLPFNLSIYKMLLLLKENGSNGIKACEDIKVPYFVALVVHCILLLDHYCCRREKNYVTRNNAPNKTKNIMMI